MGSLPAIESNGAVKLRGAEFAAGRAGLWRRIAPAIVVLLSLIPFSWVVFRNSDMPQFGKYQDDGLLLISGKSLHDSHDFRIASLPGQPYQTKYQPLYPLLLALVWSSNPNFPENLRLVAGLQWILALGFFGAAYALFRAAGFARWKSTAMVVFLATSPWLLYWAFVPSADIFFAGLTTIVFVLLHRHPANPRWGWLIGLIGGAACLTKVAGILMVPAIWIFGWRRDQWKRSLRLTAPMVIAFAGWTVWAAMHRAHGQSSVLWYYTDYVAFYVNNGGMKALPQIVSSNLSSLMETAGNGFLYNLADSLLGRFLCVLVLAAWISGARRVVARGGVPEYVTFSALLTLLLLLWNFSPNARLLAPTLPLLAMGLCAEAEHIYGLIGTAARAVDRSHRIAARVVAGSLAAGCVTALALNLIFITHGIPALLQQDRSILARDRATFNWCKRFLPARSVLLVHNDTFLFLDSGLHTVRAVPNSVALYKGDVRAQLDEFANIGPLLDFFGITHVLLTPDDFDIFEPAQQKAIHEALLRNPRLKKIYSANGATVLEVEPSRP